MGGKTPHNGKAGMKKAGSLRIWRVVVFGALVMAVTHGIVANCFSLYIAPVTRELGLTRQGFSVCQTIINLLYMGLSLFSGQIYRRFDAVKLMKVSAFALPAAYFSYSFCTGLYGFYALSVVVGISTSLLTFLPFTMILSRWFEKDQGIALGFCFMGSGAGGMLFNALAGNWVVQLGWQSTFRLLGVVMLAVLVPIVCFGIHLTPQEEGLEPLREENAKQTTACAVYGPTLREAARTGQFWVLALMALSIGLTTTMLSNTIIPHLTDLGYPATYASGVMSLYMGGLAVCKVLLGKLYDRLGARAGTILSVMAVGLGLAGLYFAGVKELHLLIVAGAAFGCASCTVGYPIITRYAFGTRDYTALYGVLNAMNCLTTSISPVYTNAVYDAQGSYGSAFLTAIVLSGITLLLIPLIRPAQAKVSEATKKPSYPYTTN